VRVSQAIIYFAVLSKNFLTLKAVHYSSYESARITRMTAPLDTAFKVLASPSTRPNTLTGL
jgi:hypothetical protein